MNLTDCQVSLAHTQILVIMNNTRRYVFLTLLEQTSTDTLTNIVCNVT